MKVEITEGGLLLVPETDFETQYVAQFQNERMSAFVKTGATARDIIGLKINKLKRLPEDTGRPVRKRVA